MGALAQQRGSLTKGIAFALAPWAMALAALGAPLATAGHPVAALVLRSFFSRLCHQDPVRSFVFDGAPVAVCVRCLGIYCGMGMGASLGSVLLLKTALIRRLLGGAVLLSILDAFAEISHLHGNLPLSRLLLGILLGFAGGVLLTSRSCEPLWHTGANKHE